MKILVTNAMKTAAVNKIVLAIFERSWSMIYDLYMYHILPL